MSNRKTPNFATQLFLRKRDLICVKLNSDGGFPVGFNSTEARLN